MNPHTPKPCFEDNDIVSISLVSQFRYCERRCYLIGREGIFDHNEFTIEGALLHRRSDEPHNEQIDEGRRISALRVFSHKYGLTGVADVVEFHDQIPFPIEFKRGRRKKWENDGMQLCAIAICLEEMFNTPVTRGAVFHGNSKRRREVVFDEQLRAKTINAIDSIRNLLAQTVAPLAVLSERCNGCSLRPSCLPELTDINQKEMLQREIDLLWK